jgi:hypothetical protein
MGGHKHFPTPIPNPPHYRDDTFRMNAPSEACHVANLNDDDNMPQMQMPAGWNTVQGDAGPLSQEGQQFEWQLPPAIPNPDPPPVLQPNLPPVLQQPTANSTTQPTTCTAIGSASCSDSGWCMTKLSKCSLSGASTVSR